MKFYLTFLVPLSLLSFCCVAASRTSYEIQRRSERTAATQKLFTDYWEWKLEDMPQFATFVGIHDYDDRLDDMSVEAYEKRYNKCQSFLTQAKLLQPTLTDEADIINIEVLEYELLTYINSYHLKGFYLPINFLEGVQIDMERVFGWMLKNTSADYDNMISRLNLLPTQIDQIIDLMTAGVLDGIIYNNISMLNMNESIGRFVVNDPTNSPFYVFFADGYPDNFTQFEIFEIQRRAQEAINVNVTPAYEKLRVYVVDDYVTRPDIAVTTMSNGPEYYDYLIEFHTSTNLSAQEIHDIGLAEVLRIEADMKMVIDEMGYGNMTTQEFSDMIRNDPNNFYDNADDLMAGFDYIVYDLIPPQLPLVFDYFPASQLEVVADPSPGGAGAYYLGGSFDGSRPGVFYVNTYDPSAQPKYDMISLSLHEGDPGHHLQGSFSIESPDFPYFRRATDDRNYGISPSRFPLYTYYVEGWALYSESLGFDMNLYGDPLDRYGHYSEEIFRACRLVVDTGMHALGWTRDQAVQYMLDHTASTEQDIQNEVNRYITWPGQALAYKMGQIRISELRLKAEAMMGPLFDIKQFHDVVLSAFGPMDLVEDEVNQWIADTIGR